MLRNARQLLARKRYSILVNYKLNKREIQYFPLSLYDYSNSIY